MKQKWYILIENWTDQMYELGEFSSIVEVWKYLEEHGGSEHWDHANGSIVMSHSQLKDLMNKIFKL